MGKSINRVDLLGRVGKAPEIKTLETGAKVANFSVATDHYMGKDRESATDWHNCTAWDNEKGQKLASLVEKYVGKGDLIHVTGRLQTRDYEKNGVKHYRTEVILNDIVLLGSKREDVAGSATPAPMKPQDVPFDEPPLGLQGNSNDDAPDGLPF